MNKEKLRPVFFWLLLASTVGVFAWLTSRAGDIALWYTRYRYTGDLGDAGSFFTAMQDLLTLTLSLLIEATPFLLLGVVVSALVRFAVPSRIWTGLANKNVVLRRTIFSFSGILLPVCECGNVPVARSLIGRGLSPGDAITFLLAAPILNPVVLFVTWQVFSYEPAIFYGRFIAALVIANAVAFVVVKLLRGRNILRPDFEASCHADRHRDKTTYKSVVAHIQSETLPLLRLLFVGAVIAGLVQVFVPRDVLVSIGSDPFMGILAMIALGFVISICSSVDAFFALAFAQTFSPGAITAFLVSGPMVDIKMIALMRSTFTLRATALITLYVFALTLLAGYIINRIAL